MKKRLFGLILAATAVAGAAPLPAALEKLFQRPPAPASVKDITPLPEVTIRSPLQGQGRRPSPILDRRLPGCQDLAFSGNGRYFLGVSTAGSICVDFQKSQGREWTIECFPPTLPGPGNAFVLTQEGATLWNAENGAARSLCGQVPLSSAAKGEVILTDDGTFFEPSRQRQVKAMKDRQWSGWVGALSADGTVLATFQNGHANAFGHDHGSTEVYDVMRNQLVMLYLGNSQENGVAVNHDGTLVAEARQDAEAVIDKQTKGTIDDGTRGDGGVTLFAREGQTYRAIRRWLPEQAATSVSFHPTQPWLAAAVESEILVWSVPDGRMVARFPARDRVLQVTFSSTGLLAARTRTDRVVVFRP